MGGRGEHRAERSLLPGESAPPQSSCVFCEEVMKLVSPVNYGLTEVQSWHMKEVTQGVRTVSGLTRIPELTEAERQSFTQSTNCWAVPKRRECSTTRKEFGFS